MIPTQQRLQSAPEFGPKLDLSGDGSLHNFTRDARIQEEIVGDFDWLTHGLKVA